MRITIDTASALETAAHFVQKAGRVKSAIDTILKKSIFVLEKHAKYYSPVDTGRMRASIGVNPMTDGKFSTGEQSVEFGDRFASIQPTVTYAKFVHRRVPFMYAAAQDSVQEIQEIASKEIKKAID